MKLPVALKVALFTFTLADAQDSTETVKLTGENLREPFTLTLAIDKERQYEQEIDAIPYVNNDIVYLFKGEIVGISLAAKENESPEVSYCQDIEKADVLFRFSQKRDKEDDSLTMLLAIDNRLEKDLFMDGIMVVPNKDRVFETTLLPLKPGTTNYESWPHPIIQLAIQSLRFQERRPKTKFSPIPKDRVVTLKDTRIEELIRSYSAMSREKLPDVIARFKRGLKEGETLFITTRISDPAVEGFEQAFVEVEAIEGDTISGKIASELTLITNYRNRDAYSCPESAILDWTIQNTDGAEEGNYIGKFMDIVKDDKVPLIFETEIDATGKVTSAKFSQAVNRYKQDVSFCIPDKARQEAEKMLFDSSYPKTGNSGKHFIYLIYRFHDDTVERPEEK
ncbi:hypothetical protein N9B21_00960 [Verrucomicrobiales bacterium]|nr:hypothetical protein [Verrucomicrobiales bacterium]MDA7926588.1 hypothetical protein [Verrucomicrobiales bacterium]